MVGVASREGLSDLLREAASRWPDLPAVVAPTATLTYAQLDAAADAGALALRSTGIRAGATAAFALAHDVAAYVAPFACDRAGVTGLLLHGRFEPDRWRRQLERARPDLFVADVEHAANLCSAGAPVTPARVALPLDDAPADPGDRRTGDADRPVLRLATSGSTGDPTFVDLTGRGLAHVGHAYLDLLDLRVGGERTLVVLPLSSVAVLSTQVVPMLLVGGCAVVPADTGYVGALDRLAEERVTLLDAPPAWLAGLVRQPPRPIPTWRTLVYGGEPMPPATVACLAARHPDVALYDVWGLTEAHGPVTARRHDRRPAPRGSVGTPLPGLRVRTAGPGGMLPPGVPGELEVHGPSVARGLPANRYHDGWLRTGDVGVVDATGAVRLLDRVEGRILRGGQTISAREVEDVLRALAGVADVAVFPVPDALGSEAVAAAVVPGEEATPDRRVLRRAVARAVGAHAVPRHVLVLDALPRTATGKVDRLGLRRRVAATTSRSDRTPAAG